LDSSISTGPGSYKKGIILVLINVLQAILKHLKYQDTEVLHNLLPTVVEKLSKNK
jgi:hypothetical protein